MRASLVIFILFGLLSCSSGSEMEDRGIERGNLAPNIITTDISGETFDLADLQGSTVLLDFWGSWCGPCIREAPEIVAIHEEFSPLGLQVVSIAIEKNDKNWKQAAEKLGYNWKHQVVEVSQFVRFNRIASDYEVTDIPSLFLLDESGRIIGSKINASEARTILTDQLK